MPHYLTEAGQEGLVNHVEAVCKSVRFGVVVYNRNVCKLTPDSLAILADRCPNLIGFKDGVGEIEDAFEMRKYFDREISAERAHVGAWRQRMAPADARRVDVDGQHRAGKRLHQCFNQGLHFRSVIKSKVIKS